MFGGFCLLFFLFTSFSRLGVDVFDASFWCLDGFRLVLIRIHLPVWVGCFCLESLILAQDERWRRA